MSIVSLKDVDYIVKENRLKQEITILQDINLIAHTGEFHLITGPSGSGKTTLLQIIGTILHPSNGEIILFNKKLSSNNKRGIVLDVRSKIGYLFQSSYLPADLTVKEYLEIQISLSKIGLTSAEKRISELLNQFNITQFSNNLPATLSRGEKQRVCLAALLAKDIKLLLLDEPTGSLDYENKKNVWELISQLKNNLTVIAVSHDESIIPKVDIHHKLEYGKLV